MYGDTPPAVIALDASSVGKEGLVRLVQEHLVQHALWLVTPLADQLRQQMEAAGIGQEGPGFRIIDGDLEDAVKAAAERGADSVRMWLDMAGFDGVPMPVRVAAHDAGIRLRLEAPFAGGAEAA